MADLSVEQGAEASLERIKNAGKEQNGKFLDIEIKGWVQAPGKSAYDGANPPW